MTVWKYVLSMSNEQGMAMPIDAEIVHVEMQGDVLCMWALVDSKNGVEHRIFRIHGTGHHVHSNEVYIGTAVSDPYVRHVFEVV